MKPDHIFTIPAKKKFVIRVSNLFESFITNKFAVLVRGRVWGWNLYSAPQYISGSSDITLYAQEEEYEIGITVWREPASGHNIRHPMGESIVHGGRDGWLIEYPKASDDGYGAACQISIELEKKI